MQTVCMKAVTEKEWQRKKTELNWCSFFHRQKAHNNARPPGTAKLRWKAILSVLETTFVVFTRFPANRDSLLKLYVLGQSARTVSRELYLEKRVLGLLHVVIWGCCDNALLLCKTSMLFTTSLWA